MKLVVAIIKPHQVEAVTTALDGIEVSGMTLTEVRGHGQQRGHSEVYRGGEYKVDFLPKVRIEVLAADSRAEQVDNTIVDNARTGKIGDGKLWIQPVDVADRIRTGDGGDAGVCLATPGDQICLAGAGRRWRGGRSRLRRGGCGRHRRMAGRPPRRRSG